MPDQGPARQKGGPGEALATGRNPTDRGKTGTKRHLLTEGKGIPIGVVVSGAQLYDMKKLADLLDASLVPYPQDAPDQPEWHLALDRGYYYDACRQTAQDHHFVPHVPPKASAAQPLPPPSASWLGRGGRSLVVQSLPSPAHSLGEAR